MFSENWKTGLATVAGGAIGNKIGDMLFGGVQKVYVVNQDEGGGLTDMLDSDGPSKNKRSRKPGKTPRTSRTKVPRTKVGKAKMVVEKGIDMVKSLFNKTKTDIPIPKDVKSMTKVVNNPATKNVFKNPKALNSLTKMLPKASKFIKGAGGALTVLTAAMDFKDRKDQGQTTTQAAVGTGAGVVGALAGAKGGAAAGAAIGALFGGVGAVPGAFIGGLIGGAGGYFLASSAADYATGVGKKPSTAKPGSSIKAPSKGAASTIQAKPSQVLSDVQYQTRLQMKMVELLGVSATLLQYILSETDKDKSIQLNNVRLNQSLMTNARKQMAISRREVVGANASM